MAAAVAGDNGNTLLPHCRREALVILREWGSYIVGNAIVLLENV